MVRRPRLLIFSARWKAIRPTSGRSSVVHGFPTSAIRSRRLGTAFGDPDQSVGRTKWGGKRTNSLSVFTALAALIEADHGLVWGWSSACGDVVGVAEVVDYDHVLAVVALYLEV